MDGSASLQGPGKLPSRLYRDLLDHDPRHAQGYCYNVLYDTPPRFSNYTPPRRQSGKDCQHALVRKDDQSMIPQRADRPPPGGFCRSASFCSKCFTHYDISIDLDDKSDDSEMPMNQVCGGGNDDFPAHIFGKVETEHRTAIVALSTDKFDPWTERHVWTCYAKRCPAMLSIKISPPRLDEEKRRLLFDRNVLRERGEKEIKNDPERFESAVPMSPGEALSVLRQYLVNADEDASVGKPPRRVAALNKKFLLSFSNECEDILRWLGFDPLRERDEKTAVLNEYWKPPNLIGMSSRAISEFRTSSEEDGKKNLKHLTNDVVYEIQQLLQDIPPHDRGAKHPTIVHLSAVRDVHFVLGVSQKQKLRTVDLDNEEPPYYAGLGITKDLNNPTVNYAYHQQFEHDRINGPYYFECLKYITAERESSGEDTEDLLTTVALAESMKQHTQTEINQAYQFFCALHHISDSELLDIYKRGNYSSPSQAEMAKKFLLTLGEHRGSHEIEKVANAKSMSIREALELLQLQDNPNPEFDDYLASATSLIADGEKDKVIEAIRVIGEHREDNRLTQYAKSLETHTTNDSPLSLSDAYAALQTPANLPDETIEQYFTQLYDDHGPSAVKEGYVRALNIIATERGSSLLLRRANDPLGKFNTDEGYPDQPVGLANIGNTCYLNSLLQYFYTVLPVREIVLDFESYRMEISDLAVDAKRVGGRKVKRSEIERAQAFVARLADLYTELKIAPSRAVRPAQDLAELTLYSESAEEEFRRRQAVESVDADVVSAKPIDSFEPPAPPIRVAPIPESHDVDMIDPPIASIEEDDTASDVTLVDDADLPRLIETANDSPSDVEMTDGTDSTVHVVDPAHVMLPRSLTAESLKSPEAIVSVAELSGQEVQEPQPAASDNQTMSKSSKLAMGAQQDVTEVIGNVMDYLRYAIKSFSMDEVTGEQQDSITKAFYGSTATYTQEKRKIEPWCNLIVFPSESGPSTIYEALDTAFDEESVELGGIDVLQRSSIVSLPSILQIQIQRTMFDKVEKLQRKNQNFVEFDEIIYLDRYMDNPAIASRKKENTKRRKRIQELERQQASILAKDDELGTSVEVLDATQQFLMSLSVDPIFSNNDSIVSALDQKSVQIQQRLEAIGEERRTLKAIVKEDFTDLREHRYVLQSVFMHRGSSGGGHHFINIFDFKNNVWREYNDERVDEVRDTTKIYKQNSFQRNDTVNTAHFLVYVLDSKKDELVDALCRNMVAGEAAALKTPGQRFDMGDSDDMVEKAVLDSTG